MREEDDDDAFIYETETGADFFMTLMLPTTLQDLAGGTGGGRSCRQGEGEENNSVRQRLNGRGERRASLVRKINQLLESLSTSS